MNQETPLLARKTWNGWFIIGRVIYPLLLLQTGCNPGSKSEFPSKTEKEDLKTQIPIVKPRFVQKNEKESSGSMYFIWKGKRGKQVPFQTDEEPTKIEDLTPSKSRYFPVSRISQPNQNHANPLNAQPSHAPTFIFGDARSIHARNQALIASYENPHVNADPNSIRQNLTKTQNYLPSSWHKTVSSSQSHFPTQIHTPPIPSGIVIPSQQRSLGIEYLAQLSTQDLETYDIAFLNLICLEGMNGFDRDEVETALVKLDQWAARVAHETARHLHQFHQNPEQYHNRESYFRMLLLITVLKEDFGVKYNDKRISSLNNPQSNASFYNDPMDSFVHGFTDRANAMGTCASLPVLYTAIAQRLRYPVKLVTAKEHLFCRWDDGRETLNIEATGNGLNCYPNSHYIKWPRSLSPAEIRSNQHLKSLSTKEAFALFLSLRSSCLIHGQNNQRGAYHAMNLASQVNPKVQNYKTAAKLLKP